MRRFFFVWEEGAGNGFRGGGKPAHAGASKKHLGERRGCGLERRGEQCLSYPFTPWGEEGIRRRGAVHESL